MRKLLTRIRDSLLTLLLVAFIVVVMPLLFLIKIVIFPIIIFRIGINEWHKERHRL